MPPAGDAWDFTSPDIRFAGPSSAGQNSHAHGNNNNNSTTTITTTTTTVQTPNARDFLSMTMNPSQDTSSAVFGAHPNGNGLADVHQADFLSLLMDPSGKVSRSVDSGTIRQSSCLSGSPTYPVSEGELLTRAKERLRPRRIMSGRQELQDAKRDFGIPPTRAGSRNASPEPGVGSRVDQTGSVGLVESLGIGPDVPGVLTAEDVAYLFNK